MHDGTNCLNSVDANSQDLIRCKALHQHKLEKFQQVCMKTPWRSNIWGKAYSAESFPHKTSFNILNAAALGLAFVLALMVLQALLDTGLSKKKKECVLFFRSTNAFLLYKFSCRLFSLLLMTKFDFYDYIISIGEPSKRSSYDIKKYILTIHRIAY